MDGWSDGDAVVLNAFQAAQISDVAARADPAVALVRYMRAPQCNVVTGGLPEPGTAASGGAGADLPACGPTNGTIQPPVCVDGPAVLPLWRQQRSGAGAAWPSTWQLVFGYSCPEDQVPTFTAEDLRRLPLVSTAVTTQPPSGPVLVNVDSIMLADAASQSFTTDLLGFVVDVVATPAVYTWDYGDGSRPVSTTSPGRPYPEQDVVHVYTQPGTYTIGLVTTWTARYRVAGSGVWRDVVGTATTTTALPAWEAVERRAQLVATDCLQDPSGAGCG